MNQAARGEEPTRGDEGGQGDEPARGDVAAFFDMDFTLVTENTAALYVKYLRRHGLARRRDVLRTLWWTLLYRAGSIDMAAVVGRVAASMEGDDEAEMIALCDRWYAEDVRPHVSDDGRRAIERHRQDGHRLVLLTGSSPYASGPLARELGFDDVICTRLEVADGRFTGRVVDPVCYAEGKVHWARRFAEAEGVDLSRSWFYTDSHTDLPMLEVVGEPRVVNPDRRLAAAAARRGWQVLTFA